MPKNVRKPMIAAMVLAGLWAALCLVRPATNGAAAARPASASTPTLQPASTSQPASAPATQSAVGIRVKPLTWDDLPGSGSPNAPQSPNLLWRTLASVVVIFVLGALALLVTRRWLPRIARASGKGSTRAITLLETVYLGPRKPVHLVQVGRRRFLAAGTRDQVCILTDVTDAFDAASSEEKKPS